MAPWQWWWPALLSAYVGPTSGEEQCSSGGWWGKVVHLSVASGACVGVYIRVTAGCCPGNATAVRQEASSSAGSPVEAAAGRVQRGGGSALVGGSAAPTAQPNAGNNQVGREVCSQRPQRDDVTRRLKEECWRWPPEAAACMRVGWWTGRAAAVGRDPRAMLCCWGHHPAQASTCGRWKTTHTLIHQQRREQRLPLPPTPSLERACTDAPPPIHHASTPRDLAPLARAREGSRAARWPEAFVQGHIGGPP